jgi:YD repeat-containing protein
LVWDLQTAPAGMVIDPQTGALRWQPGVPQIGTHEIAVRLTDALGQYVVQAFTLKVSGANNPPQISSTPLTRAAINQDYRYSVIAKDPENDSLRYSLGRRPEGMSINTQGQITWRPTTVGTVDIDVQVTDSQGATTTQTYRIEVGSTAINQAPSITSTPRDQVNIAQPYSYQVQATDPEGTPLTYQLLQAPSGMSIDAVTGLVTWNQPLTGTYQVTVGAVDAGGLGVAQVFTLTAKANRPPLIQSAPSLSATPRQEYRYDLIARDPDGDRLSYSLDTASLAKGITLDTLGRLRWTPTASQLGSHSITLTVTDATGASVAQQFTLQVTADTTAPLVNLLRSTDIADPGEIVRFYVQASDNIGVTNLQLLVNGTAVALDGNGIGTYTATTPGVISAQAIATDAAGNSAQANTTVNVLDTSDTEAPVISLDLTNLPDSVIGAPTQIRGTVTDTNLDYYILEIAPQDGSAPFKEIFRGTGTVTNGVLGNFDPTLLQNDSYTLRLTAYDTNGRGTTTEQQINVTGDLKLGNFRLSFTDLAVPVTGIPITLTRTYDTLTSGYKDDFGYGWRMEFRDTDLRVNLPKDPTFDQLGIRTVGFKEGTKVFITLPGGTREAFTFKPTVDPISRIFPSIAGFDTNLYNPAFTSDKGVTSTLSIPGSTGRSGWITRTEDDTFVKTGAGVFYNPADPYFGGQYLLTTKEGVEYLIDGQSGDLLKVTDTNGNTLTYTDTAVISSTGKQVAFTRDAQRRITSVTDPLGNQIRYAYDAAGDLVSVTDAEGNVTRMVYDTSYDDPLFPGTGDIGRTKRSHFLREIIDPLGRSGVKSEYDADGRLKQLVDANGNPVEMLYDPTNSIQRVKDALGNTTTYEYDDRGNVLTEIDPVGQVIRRVYDENNWVLSETVISDRSGVNGFTTTYTYDREGNRLTETDELGNITRFTYGSKGRLLTETDPLGRTTTNTYSASGNLTSTKDANGNITRFTYSARGNLLSMVDAQGQATQFAYDISGNVTRMVDALGHVTTFTYNDKGDKLSETRTMNTPNGVRNLFSTWTYDANGRMLTMTDAEGATTRYEYNALGQHVAMIDALGRKTQSRYNDRGELVEVIYPDVTPNDTSDNLRTQTRYDANGRRIASIDMAGRETQFVYDDAGRLIEVIYPDATPTIWTDNARSRTEYFTDGLVKAQIDERGNRTEFLYDAEGKQIAILYPDTTPAISTDNSRTQFVYDAAGQQIAVTDALGQTTRYFYDDLGRLITTRFADGSTASSTYDSLSRRLVSTDQNGKVTRYRYDALDRLTGVQNALGDWTEYGYNEVGNLIWQEDALVYLPLGQSQAVSYPC